MDEMANLSDALKILSDHKDSAGHKAFVEIAYQNLNAHLMEFMFGKDDVDLQQLRANFKAWADMIQAVDKRVMDYTIQIKQVLEGTERQMQAMQGRMMQ